MEKNNKNWGGLRKGSGRGIKGSYKGYWCDSSWELAWVVYHLENGFAFERNNEGFEYSFNGKIKKYYPDFIMDGKYYEIKGRGGFNSLDSQNKQKILQFKGDIVVFYKKEMEPILQYCISKYGIDFTKLYEEKCEIIKKCNNCDSNLYKRNKSGYCIKCFNKFNVKTIKKVIYCECCGKEKSKKGKLCSDCYSNSQRKVERPPYKQLIEEINELGYCGTGRKYGVSDNAIRKWKKYYENQQVGNA